MLRLGWKAGPEQYAPVELLQYAIAADKAGFDFLDVSDHFHPWSEEGQCPFSWTWLGATAVQTQNIQIGTGVTCPIIRYHPSIIAQAAATLACLAPGRAYLGLGTGEALNEYATTGRWPEYKERQEMLLEAIELMRALWKGENVSFRGQYYQTEKARLFTLPATPVPIYISALVPDSAEFAGKHGDGLFTVGGKQPEIYRALLQHFEQGAKEAGKNAQHMPRIIELNVAYTDDIEAGIEEQLKYWAGTYVPALFDQKIYTPAMSQENGEVIGADTVKKTGCFSASLDDHIQFIQQYIELGFDTLVFHCPGPDQKKFIERYSRDVLPKVRSMSSNAQKAGAIR
jgi:coenzyme F420-dependent glucose-6-phosphate dehydrogenase